MPKTKKQTDYGYRLGIDLQQYFKPVKKVFRKYKDYTLDRDNNDKHRIFIDNGAKVLFVAHLDTVIKPKYIGYAKTDKGEPIVKARGLDDRLGWYVIDKLVNRHGLKADILLTDHEEIGGSTAKYHKLKKYNWLAEFDRKGDDYVNYRMTSPDFEKALDKHFPKSGWGSFSDVCCFRDKYYKVCAVNVGVGYHSAHFKDSYVLIDQHDTMINRFIGFYKENHSKRFDRKVIATQNNWWLGNQQQHSTKHNTWYSNQQKQRTIKAKDLTCQFCQFAGAELIHNYLICPDCMDYAIEASGIGSLSLACTPPQTDMYDSIPF
jgi:hypothetical protein